MSSSWFQRLVMTDCWYVRDLQMVRITCWLLKPFLTNSSVRRSSSRGLLGGLPARDVVDWFNDAHPEQIGPKAVDVAACEVGVFLAGDPVSHLLPGAWRWWERDQNA